MDQQARRVIFSEREQARVEMVHMPGDPDVNAVLIRNAWSLISPGTELALYTNRHDINGRHEQPYPIYPGYAAVGIIEKVGKSVKGFQSGDVVLTFSSHASHAYVNPASQICVKIPAGLPIDYAPFARMAIISLATLVTSPYLVNEWLGVVGLGLVGNLSAQFAQIAGARVIGFGRSQFRNNVARRCGIEVLEGETAEAAEKEIRCYTGGEGCRLVLETSGSVEGMMKALAIAENGGTISLVGVPWQSDARYSISQVLQPVFSRYLRIQGGWEWGIPLQEMEAKSTYLLANRASTERNTKFALQEISQGRVQVEPLITHRKRPDQIQEAYQSLLVKQSQAVGVLIDWREG